MGFLGSVVFSVAGLWNQQTCRVRGSGCLLTLDSCCGYRYLLSVAERRLASCGVLHVGVGVGVSSRNIVKRFRFVLRWSFRKFTWFSDQAAAAHSKGSPAKSSCKSKQPVNKIWLLPSGSTPPVACRSTVWNSRVDRVTECYILFCKCGFRAGIFRVGLLSLHAARSLSLCSIAPLEHSVKLAEG